MTYANKKAANAPLKQSKKATKRVARSRLSGRKTTHPASRWEHFGNPQPEQQSTNSTT